MKRAESKKPEPSQDKTLYENLTKRHYILGNFFKLSIFAIRKGCSDTGARECQQSVLTSMLCVCAANSPLFNFGVEVQWRIALFR